MALECSKPPFVFAGNLDASPAGRILTFALAPHASNEQAHPNMEAEFQWRLRYFDQEKMPHRLHSFYAKILQGVLNCNLPFGQSESRWLDALGYLTFDLVPFYAKKWVSPTWRKQEVTAVVQRHFCECLKLVADKRVSLALFSGKAWEDLLLGSRGHPQFGDFRNHTSFQLCEVTGNRHHVSRVSVGELHFSGESIPSVVIGALIHRVYGFSYADAVAVGERIRTFSSTQTSEPYFKQAAL